MNFFLWLSRFCSLYALFCLVLLGFDQVAKAESVAFDANVFYNSSSGTYSSDNGSTKTFSDAFLGFGLGKRSQIQVGWSYSIFQTEDTGDSDGTYSSTETGPKFVYYFDDDRTFGFSLTYNLIVNAENKLSGGTEEELRGVSYKVDLGYAIPLSENSRLGLRVVYNQANFDEQVDGSTLTEVDYKQTFIYPALNLSYIFD